MLTTFFIYTFIMWLAGYAVLRLFYMLIAPDGAFDVLFGWQAMLRRLYGHPNRNMNLLGKALGDCHICTAFWFMPLWYGVYCLTSHLLLNFWISTPVESLGGKIFINIIWYIVFHAIGAMGGFISLIRFSFKKKENAV